MIMKLITRNTDYALRALCVIAKDSHSSQKVVAVSELAEHLHIPRPFLRKILQILSRKGILRSFRGNNGGFSLAKSANMILLTEVIEAFQGKVRLNECIFKKEKCADINSCILRQKIKNIETAVIKELRAITLASLLS